MKKVHIYINFMVIRYTSAGPVQRTKSRLLPFQADLEAHIYVYIYLVYHVYIIDIYTVYIYRPSM